MPQQTVGISLCVLVAVSWILFAASAAAENSTPSQPRALVEAGKSKSSLLGDEAVESVSLSKLVRLLRGPSIHTHVWPELEFGWRIVVGTLIAFSGAAFGSAGGIGAGGIFVPMLTLIVGFDPKSSTAISKCMIMGLTSAIVYYNIKQRHPTLDHLPIIDYDLALLVQPMLLLGISTGVTLNVIFANWMVTILLIVTFLGISIRSFMKGVDMWKKETVKKKEAAQHLHTGQGIDIVEYNLLPGGPTEQQRVLVTGNVYWKEVIIFVTVWVAFLAIQISKDYTTTCSVAYWVLNSLQIPVAVGATGYQAAKLRNRSIETTNSGNSDVETQWIRRPHLLVLCSFVALLAGTLGGLLGLGGGFVLGPMFLEIGIIPQVSTATTTFVMAFSSSMCAIEYYLLKRFPLPYALYFVGIAIAASLTGQYVVRKWIARAGRASMIVFILASIIFASAILLGGEGIANMIYKIQHNEYMGFEDLCTSGT